MYWWEDRIRKVGNVCDCTKLETLDLSDCNNLKSLE